MVLENKIFHLLLDDCSGLPTIFNNHNFTTCLDYDSTYSAIQRGERHIKTTQLILCTTDLFDKGYQIWINRVEESIEMKIGDTLKSGRELRKEHNLPKLIMNGEVI